MRNAFSIARSRRTILAGFAALLVAARKPRSRSPRVLFVCLHGTVKSPIARELLRSQAKERHLAVAVRSCGIDPAEGASRETAAALSRDGIDVRRDPLRRLDQRDLVWADVVVFFDPLPFAPVGRALHDWRDTPSVNQNYREAMTAISAKIEALLDGLARHG